MIDKGINFNVVNHEGMSPLQRAAVSAVLEGRVETLRALLEKPGVCEVNYQNKKGGWTALNYALSNNICFADSFFDDKTHDLYAKKHRASKAADLLIEHGALPLIDNLGRTPLLCISDTNHFQYNNALMRRYYEFEAKGLKIPPEKYLEVLPALQKMRGLFLACVKGDSTEVVSSRLNKFWSKTFSQDEDLSHDVLIYCEKSTARKLNTFWAKAKKESTENVDNATSSYRPK